MLALATLTGFWGHWGWPFDLTSHFRVLYVLGLTGTAVFFLLRRRYRMAGVATFFALLNGWVILPMYRPLPESAVASPVYRAVSYNIHYENPSVDPLITFIQTNQPDFFVLVETTDAQLTALKPLEAEYPYVHRAYFKGHESRVIFSRHPFVQTSQVADVERPSAVVQLLFNGQPLTLIAAHPNSPVRPENSLLQQQQFHHLAQFIARQNTPVLLLGDLNTTPWSAVFRQFNQESGLQNGRIHFGIQPTWPTPWPFIPIDHALVSPGITIHQFQTGPSLGSDHTPILIEFSLPAD